MDFHISPSSQWREGWERWCSFRNLLSIQLLWIVKKDPSLSHMTLQRFNWLEVITLWTLLYSAFGDYIKTNLAELEFVAWARAYNIEQKENMQTGDQKCWQLFVHNHDKHQVVTALHFFFFQYLFATNNFAGYWITVKNLKNSCVAQVPRCGIVFLPLCTHPHWLVSWATWTNLWLQKARLTSMRGWQNDLDVKLVET